MIFSFGFPIGCQKVHMYSNLQGKKVLIDFKKGPSKKQMVLTWVANLVLLWLI